MVELGDWKQFQFFEPSERGPKELTVALPEGHPLAPKKVQRHAHARARARACVYAYADACWGTAL